MKAPLYVTVLTRWQQIAIAIKIYKYIYSIFFKDQSRDSDVEESHVCLSSIPVFISVVFN